MTDQAQMSPALLGFYACCALVSAGAGAFFFAWFVLSEPAYGVVPTILKTVGIGMLAVGLPGSYICLGKARQQRND